MQLGIAEAAGGARCVGRFGRGSSVCRARAEACGTLPMMMPRAFQRVRRRERARRVGTEGGRFGSEQIGGQWRPVDGRFVVLDLRLDHLAVARLEHLPSVFLPYLVLEGTGRCHPR